MPTPEWRDRGKVLPEGPELLVLERRARSAGTGLDRTALQGVWCLERLWQRRDGAPSDLAAGMLRALGARLVIGSPLREEEQEPEPAAEPEAVTDEVDAVPLRLCNAVHLAGVELRFLGEAVLEGRRPLLVFRFDALQLSLAGRVLLRRPLPRPDQRRRPFFALIALGSDGQGGSWLAARGRGGGLALWCRCQGPQTSP